MIENLSFYFYLFKKISLLLGAGVYLVFALIIVKQTATMSKNINDKFNYVLIAFSYIHLAFSILLILLTLVLI